MTNQLEKVYFTTKEALEDIKSTLENGYYGYLCDLQGEVFNTKYYIIGTSQSEKALEQYGVSSAIGEIKEYEEFNFGEVYTTFDDPERIANMLYYIVGEGVINEILDNETNEYWNDEVTDEIRDLLISKIDSLLSKM